jgi:hypothetical protein
MSDDTEDSTPHKYSAGELAGQAVKEIAGAIGRSGMVGDAAEKIRKHKQDIRTAGDNSPAPDGSPDASAGGQMQNQSSDASNKY